MKPIASVLITAFCFSGLAVAETTESLSHVVDQAIVNYPSLQAAEERVQAGELGVDSAAGKQYPQITFSGQYGREKTDSPSTRSAGFSDRELTRRENGVTLTQSIFDGGEIVAGVARAEAELREQKAAHIYTREELIYQVISRYINVLRAGELLAAAKLNQKQHTDIGDLVRKRVDKQVDSKASSYLVEGRLAVANLKVERYTELLKRAELELAKFTGKQPEKLEAIPTSVMAVNSEYDIESHPSLRMLHARQQADRQAVEEKKGALGPKVDLELVARRDYDLDGTEGRSEEMGAYITVEFNLFDGGSNRAALNQASKRHQASKLDYEEEKLNIQTALQVAYSALRSAQAELRYFSAHREELEKAKEAYGLQYMAGRRTLFDLLNIQSEYFDASESAIQARHDEYQKAIDVKFEAATLNQTVNEL